MTCFLEERPRANNEVRVRWPDGNTVSSAILRVAVIALASEEPVLAAALTALGCTIEQ